MLPLPGCPRTAAPVVLLALLALALFVAPVAQAPAQTSSVNSTPVVPPNVQALEAINLSLRTGDKPAALKLAEEAVLKFPRDAQLRFVHAVVLGDLGRTGEATAAFEAMCSEFPELPEPYNNLAAIRANEGKYAEAVGLLQQAITAQPGYITARENLGDMYIAMAMSTYEKAGKLDPANAILKKKLALAREVSGKLRSARAH